MKKSNFPQFEAFACIGDSVSWEKNGFTLTATLEEGPDTNVRDYECYTSKQISAWRNDEWLFVGVVVSVKRGGIEILEHAASRYGLDCNFPSLRKNPNWYLSSVLQELEPEALEAAESRVSEIRKKFGF